MVENSNVTARRDVRGYGGLWELLTKTNVDRSFIMPQDMSSYMRILESTNRHLTNNDRSIHIKTTRVPEYRVVISKLFLTESRRQNWASQQ